MRGTIVAGDLTSALRDLTSAPSLGGSVPGRKHPREDGLHPPLLHLSTGPGCGGGQRRLVVLAAQKPFPEL